MLPQLTALPVHPNLPPFAHPLPIKAKPINKVRHRCECGHVHVDARTNGEENDGAIR